MGLCAKSIRIEDDIEGEMTDLFLEMLQCGGLPNSTIVFLGSVTSMLQQGVVVTSLIGWHTPNKLGEDGEISRYVCSAATYLGGDSFGKNAP